MTDFAKHADTMRLVAADCAEDATKLDSTPFTPRGVGETLGSMLAMIAACAKTNAVIADTLAAHNLTLGVMTGEENDRP